MSERTSFPIRKGCPFFMKQSAPDAIYGPGFPKAILAGGESIPMFRACLFSDVENH